MKKIVFTVALAVLLAVPLGSAFAVESFVQPSGVIQYNPDKSYGGYQLFAGTGAGNTTSYLIDMEGYVINEWKRNYVVSLHEWLLPNGNLLVAQQPWTLPLPPGVPSDVKMRKQTWPMGAALTATNGVNVGGGHGGYLQEFDWNGNVVWDYELNDATHVQHHTFTPSPWTPGNVLILGWEWKSRDEAIAKGRNPATIGVRGIWPDYVIEVNRAKQIVWEFHVWDNLIQNFDPTKANYGDPKANPDKWDINWIQPGSAVIGSDTVASSMADWTHWNTANYHPTDSNKIVTNSRHMGESYIIDKAAKRLIWRFGNPSVYGAGKAPSFMNDGDQLLWGPHHAHVIPPGLPGAGNMLILDNGWNRVQGNRTRSVEVDMSQPSNTAYATGGTGALPTGNTAVPGTMHPGHIVWQYAGARPNSMYSASQCANQRLPNGNTSITITETGHIIEVTRGVQSGVNWINKEVVWEFINPLYSTGTATTGYTYPNVACLFNDGGVGGSGTTLNPTSIHRSTRIGADDPALQGKDLSRRYRLNEGCPEFWKMLTYPSLGTQGPTTGWDPQSPGPIPVYTGFGFGRAGSVAVGGSGGSGGGAGGAGGGGGGY